MNFQSPFQVILHLDENIASNWDLYLITILTLFLGMIIYFRRPTAPEANIQNNQNNADTPQQPPAAPDQPPLNEQ